MPFSNVALMDTVSCSVVYTCMLLDFSITVREGAEEQDKRTEEVQQLNDMDISTGQVEEGSLSQKR